MSPRHLALPLLFILAVIGLLIHGPIPQDQSYHNFVDQRSLWGIPNFMDVITNLPFLLIGIWGSKVSAGLRPITMRRICTLMFTGFVALTFGSGWYHWRPEDLTLMFDRIPIAVIFMAFFSIFIHDHIGEWYGSRALPTLAIVGVGSVVWWYASELAGEGDLRPYALVQFFPLVAIPVIVKLYRSRYDHRRELVAIYLFFGLAKLAGSFDEEVFSATNGLIGGHAFKHLFMALAGAFIVVMVRRRQPVQHAARA